MMAARSVSSEDNSGHYDETGNTRDYFRQMTLNDSNYAALYRPSESRALVRRPSVDFAKLTKKESRAIIDRYFRRSAPPPVLEHMSKEILKKISDTELGKVLTLQIRTTTPTIVYYNFLSNHFIVWFSGCVKRYGFVQRY